jgi:hypothetical protein
MLQEAQCSEIVLECHFICINIMFLEERTNRIVVFFNIDPEFQTLMF